MRTGITQMGYSQEYFIQSMESRNLCTYRYSSFKSPFWGIPLFSLEHIISTICDYWGDRGYPYSYSGNSLRIDMCIIR